ncbi:MAG: Dabb family protein [Cytophagaceae bacterium]
MLKHIVCWRIKDLSGGVPKKEALLMMKQKLDELPERISEIIEFEVGININPSEAAYDISLYSSFKDEEALEAYQQHPAHQEVGKFIKEIASQRAVVDYLV